MVRDQKVDKYGARSKSGRLRTTTDIQERFIILSARRNSNNNCDSHLKRTLANSQIIISDRTIRNILHA